LNKGLKEEKENINPAEICVYILSKAKYKEYRKIQVMNFPK
jgi:hypothetical protein